MPVGKVKWFDSRKGYGFIVGDQGQDVFVHYTSIVGEGFRALKDGESVQYELVLGDKGWQARNVMREAEAEAVAARAPQASA
jgi:CspA family cold shock protein